MITISFANQKGGVGKTSSCAAAASLLAERGYRVLAVDLDAQGNLTDAFGISTDEAPTAYEVLRGQRAADDVIVRAADGVDVLPCDLSFAGIDMELASAVGRERRLATALAPVRDAYDVCLVDCPPTLGLVVNMALSASDYVVVPCHSSFLSAKGMQSLMMAIQVVKSEINPGLEVAGLLFTLYDPRTVIAKEFGKLAESLSEAYSVPVFDARIRKAVVVEDQYALGKPLPEVAPKANVTWDYRKFATELERACSLVPKGKEVR